MGDMFDFQEAEMFENLTVEELDQVLCDADILPSSSTVATSKPITKNNMREFNIDDLKKEIPYKWKVQTQTDHDYQFNGPSVTCAAYIDARQAQDLLDEVLGPENWSVEFSEKHGQLFCKVGVFYDGRWIYKEDVGTESVAEKEKGQVSDAFKRAAVHWGVGRFLYKLEMVKLRSEKKTLSNGRSKHTPVTDQGKKLYGGDSLTEYIKSIASKSNDKAHKNKNMSASTHSLEKDAGERRSDRQGHSDTKDEGQKVGQPMPSSFKKRFLNKDDEPSGSDEAPPSKEKKKFNSGDSEIDSVLHGLFYSGNLEEGYLLDNKKWLTGLPSERKSAFFKLVPEEFKQRVVELLSSK